MGSPLVSIVIPFYNEEICLPRAVQSVLNQSYSNTEIILVNDGSTDNSKIIAEKLCRLHSHIQLINSVSGAPGAARNKGIVLAKGNYLTFLDADDEFETEMVQTCINEILINDCDVINIGHSLYDKKGKIIKIFTNSGITSIMTGIETIKNVYNNKVFPTSSAKLFKTETIKKIRFTEKIWSQDNPFFLEVLFNSKKIGFIKDSLLKIHSRNNSISRRTVSKKRVVDLNKAFSIELNHVKRYMPNIFDREEVIKLIFMNHFRAMLDIFIVLMIDRPKLTEKERKIVQQCYINCLTEIKPQFDKKKLQFPKKNRILFFILYSPKIIGWRIPELLIYFLKYKRVKFLNILKG